MATPQLSPGVLIREVDLTVGRADNVFENTGGICAPFSKGPVNEVIDITSEQELLNVYGKPLSTDRQYEWWLSASSFLTYGGKLKTVRVDGNALKNAIVGSGVSTPAVKIRNFDEYSENYAEADAVNFLYAAKNPGTWANGLKVCTIDAFADQRVAISTSNPVGSGITVGTEIFKTLTAQPIAGAGETSSFTGKLRGIVVGINSSTTGTSTVDIKIISRLSTSGVTAGTETVVDYASGSSVAAFNQGDTISFQRPGGTVTLTGIGTQSTTTTALGTVLDWYNEQTLGLTNNTIYWKTLAPRPKSTNYSLARGGKNDELHLVVIDDLGTFTGTKGTLVEKFVGLSKAQDSISEINSPSKNWYKSYIANFSSVLYAGTNQSSGTSAIAPQFTTVVGGISTTPDSTSNGIWNQEAQGTSFNVIGNKSYTLGGDVADGSLTYWKGVDYAASNQSGQFAADLGSLNTAYGLFDNDDDKVVDYLIGGPGLPDETQSQAYAINLITIAANRKDCLAVISPNRSNVLGSAGPLGSATQTTNINRFFNGISISSSYGVFDSGWKYTYDRFNNQFVYIPCNADVAGLMVRTSLDQYSWYSPAGQQRGVLNNAIKLAYNPSKLQRDAIYPNRINPIISSPGTGILLFGDKTALTYQSAFDRINVRRLFITIKRALKRAAEAQLFEFNDSITRANFVNIVEPYLRDVQSKRGVYDFLVVCDESNNTPDIIDNNEFRAEIYLKPAKSINFVTLTFVATRTGVSFDEVVGTV
jgi:hypothetical protein